MCSSVGVPVTFEWRIRESNKDERFGTSSEKDERYSRSNIRPMVQRTCGTVPVVRALCSSVVIFERYVRTLRTEIDAQHTSATPLKMSTNRLEAVPP